MPWWRPLWPAFTPGVGPPGNGTSLSLGSAEPADTELPGFFGAFSDDPEALIALYPAEDYDTNLARYQAMCTDVRFNCPTLAFAEAADTDTYVYHYTYVSPDDPFGLGATHGSVLVPLFAHPEGIAALPPGLAGSDAATSDDMQAAWVVSATSGSPGDGCEPYGDGGRITVLDQPVQLVDKIRDGRCDDVDRLTTLRR